MSRLNRGSIERLSKRYRDPNGSNKRLTENFSLSYNSRNTKRNCNTIVLGSSGTGKTYRFIEPNLMTCENSVIVVDAKRGELFNKYRELLKERGFAVKVLNLIDPSNSDHYDPLRYIRKENPEQYKDICTIEKWVCGSFKDSEDPFWDTAAKMLFLACTLCVWEETSENPQKSFYDVLDLIDKACTVSNDGTCEADPVFNKHFEKYGESAAWKCWTNFNKSGPDVKKDLAIFLRVKMNLFEKPFVKGIFKTDDMDLSSIGEKKTAVFLIVDDTDVSLNPVISLFYSQLFSSLLDNADYNYGGTLPVPVEVYMDEFANIPVDPLDFTLLTSVLRPRRISVSVIVQNLNQLELVLGKYTETVINNCDTLLYFGGAEIKTCKFIAKLASRDNDSSRDVEKTISVLQSIAKDKAILFIRGEDPVFDYKIKKGNQIKKDKL